MMTPSQATLNSGQSTSSSSPLNSPGLGDAESPLPPELEGNPQDSKGEPLLAETQPDAADVPSVSVIVPVYNGEVFLPLLLQSLSQLDYPSDRLEVLIVNNNSSDRTAEILAESPFKTVFEARPGAGAARNAGIREATGEFLAFTDADCVVTSSWIRDLLAGFVDPSIGAVAGAIAPHQLNHPIERYESLRLNCPGHRQQHIFLPIAVTANVMYRAEVFRKVGGFLEQSSAEDTDFCWRMQTQTSYRIHFLGKEGLVWHRYRSNLQVFCRTQRHKSQTLIGLHHRWNLRVPTGRKELLRTAIAAGTFLPAVIQRTLHHRDRLLKDPGGVLYDSVWESWLDILVPWSRFRGIREGLRQQQSV